MRKENDAHISRNGWSMINGPKQRLPKNTAHVITSYLIANNRTELAHPIAWIRTEILKHKTTKPNK